MGSAKEAAAVKKRHGARNDRAVQGICLRRRRRPRRWLPLKEGRNRGRGRRRRRLFCRSARRHLRRPPLGDLVASTEGRPHFWSLPCEKGAQRDIQRREEGRGLPRRELLRPRWILGWNP